MLVSVRLCVGTLFTHQFHQLATFHTQRLLAIPSHTYLLVPLHRFLCLGQLLLQGK